MSEVCVLCKKVFAEEEVPVKVYKKGLQTLLRVSEDIAQQELCRYRDLTEN